MRFLPNFHPLYPCRSCAASHSLSIFGFFKSPNPHSSVKNWTKWVLILTKFDVHHGLPTTTHHKFSTLVPLSFLRCVPFVINFSVVFFSPYRHSCVKNCSKWIPILTKLDVHHGLFPAQLSTRSQLLFPLRSSSALISFLFTSFKKLLKTKKKLRSIFWPPFFPVAIGM